MKNNILSRGLAVLQAVSTADRPLRFSELRTVAMHVPDSTLCRLLQSLESSGHLTHQPDVGYTPGPQIQHWLKAVRKSPQSFQDCAAAQIQILTSTIRESAAVALHDGEAIRILKSKTEPDAISIIEEGEILHFESDHAASLAILHQMKNAALNQALKSRYSRIRNAQEYGKAVKATLRKDGLWLDRSQIRPGICRMALPFSYHKCPGAIFLCLTLETARKKTTALFHALRIAQQELQKADS